MNLFVPTGNQAYIKLTPQASKKSSGIEQIGDLAASLVPAFDASKFIFDLVETEEHILDSIIPMNPIEDGTYTTDNITNMPDVLNLSVLITDTPISPVDPTVGRFESGKGRSIGEYGSLKKMRAERQPMTVVTGLEVYQNMAIRRIEAIRDNRGYVVACSISFVKLQIAQASGFVQSSFGIAPSVEFEHTISVGAALGVVAMLAFVGTDL